MLIVPGKIEGLRTQLFVLNKHTLFKMSLNNFYQNAQLPKSVCFRPYFYKIKLVSLK